MWLATIVFAALALYVLWCRHRRAGVLKTSSHGAWRVLGSPSPSVPAYVLSSTRQSGSRSAPETPAPVLQFVESSRVSSKQNRQNPAVVESTSSQLMSPNKPEVLARPPLSSPSFGTGSRFAEFMKSARSSRVTLGVSESPVFSGVLAPTTVRKRLVFASRRTSPGPPPPTLSKPRLDGAPTHASHDAVNAILSKFDELQSGVEETRQLESSLVTAFLVRLLDHADFYAQEFVCECVLFGSRLGVGLTIASAGVLVR
jgi:hypothetical protein